MKLAHLLFLSFILFPFHSHAMEDLNVGGASAVIRKISINCRQAEIQYQQNPTPQTLTRLTQAYGETEAASRLWPVLQNQQQLQTVCAALSRECREAELANQEESTPQTISVLTKAYGSTGVVSKILAAIERDRTIVSCNHNCNYDYNTKDSRDPKGYYGSGEGSGGYGW